MNEINTNITYYMLDFKNLKKFMKSCNKKYIIKYLNKYYDDKNIAKIVQFSDKSLNIRIFDSNGLNEISEMNLPT